MPPDARFLPRLAALAAAAVACSCREAPPAPEGAAAPRTAGATQAVAGQIAVAAQTTSAAQTAGATKPGSAAAAPAGGSSRVVLVFSAALAGQIVPCGCSPDQRGGLPRATAALAKLRERDPRLIFIDAGDSLFASARPPPRPAAPQAVLKARALAEGDALLGAAARVLGARELALGPAFADETAAGVPLLDAGGAPVPGARAEILLPAGADAVQVGIFAAGLGDDPGQTIAARAAALRARGARLLVLVLHPRGDRALAAAEALLPAARAAGVDLAVLGRRDDPATDPEHVTEGSPPLFALEGHGQELLRIELEVPKGASGPAPLFLARGDAARQAELKELDERIALTRERAAAAGPDMRGLLEAKVAELQRRRQAAAAAVDAAPPGAIAATASFLPLDKSAGEDARAAALVARYDAQVAELNLAEARKLPASCPRPGRGEPAYVGLSARVQGQSCASCHPTEAAFWERTAHARAYATLEQAKKQFSLDCIRCHVTGWQQPGGVCRIDRTQAGGPGLAAHGQIFGLGRRDVQCEMCHGPASEHVREPPEHIAARVPEQICKRCHEAANSPRFDDARYRPFIVGPGHGEPLADGAQPRSRGEIDSGKAGPNEGPATGTR